MIIDQTFEPRCSSCGSVVLRAGTSCTACDTDTHFEGANRTAPDVATQTMRGSHKLADLAGRRSA